MRLYLSRYGRLSRRPAPVSQMMSAFAREFRDGVDINLGVGYVNERTIPVEALRQALDAVILNRSRYRQAFNYGAPDGSPNLIRSIRDFLARNRIGGLDEATLARKRLVIGPCGATSLLDGLTEVLPRGLVITSDPIYYIYSHALERKGFRILAIPEDEQGIRVDLLADKLERSPEEARRVSFFYIVTVNNPSATILSNRRRRELLDFVTWLCRKHRRRIPLVFDLAYELLVHDPSVEAPLSMLPFDELGIVYEVGTLSKIIAPALRIGYLLGPDDELLAAMVQKSSDAGFSAPLFAQEMASYLLDHYAEEQLERVRAGYREKATAAGEAIRQWLGDYLQECRGGQAGFYFYLTFQHVETHTRSPFFLYLARQTGEPEIDGPPEAPHPRVVYIPGEYCVHRGGQLVELGKRQLRISYGFEELPRILEGIRLMREAAAWATERPAAVLAEPVTPQ